MGKYREKAGIIEAFQMTKERRWDNSEWPDWLGKAWNKEPGESGCLFCGDESGIPGPGESLYIKTPGGTHAVTFGDYIIQGTQGEIYPCKEDIFEATYISTQKKDIIIFDIDGTLSLVGDRVKYLLQSPKDWDSYFNRCDEDLPNKPVHTVFHGLIALKKFTLIIVTGRRESTRHKTTNWLLKNGIYILQDNLRMRRDGDHRHDTEVKPEMVQDILPRIAMVFEDRDSVVKMWRDMGIPCFQVAPGDF